MTKPSDFIFSSDYLTLAEERRMPETTVFFASQAFPVQAYTLKPFYISQDLYFPAVKGAIDRVYIKFNGLWHCCDSMQEFGDLLPMPGSGELYIDQRWAFNVYRKNADYITARCDFMPPSWAESIPHSPSLSFSIVAQSFRPPNVS